MEKFGVTDAQILNSKMDENYRSLMKHLIQRARDYYAQADTGIPMLHPDSRMAVQV
jgi:phytoene synthase